MILRVMRAVIYFAALGLFALGMWYLEQRDLEKERLLTLRWQNEILVVPDTGACICATATWYARQGDRWWDRIPALGLRDGTRRRIRDYARQEWCVAVPARDTLEFPLGSLICLSGARGSAIARVVDVNLDTTFDLIGGLFPALVGNYSRGVGKVFVRKIPSKKEEQ